MAGIIKEYSRSDKNNFDAMTAFLICLLVSAPLIIFMFIAWLLKIKERRKTAKVFIFMALGYVILMTLLAIVFLLSK